MPGDVCDRLSKIIYRKTIKFICFSDFIVYICNAEPETTAFTMETECVIRIPILPLPAAAFAVHIATRRRFSEADGSFSPPVRIAPPVYAGGVREDRGAYDTNL